MPPFYGTRGAGVICSAKRGRKSTPDAKPKRRGPKPTTSADTLQTIDEATLQEFRQQAALEEATRVPEVVEPESEPQRFNFHRVLLNAASRGLTEVAEDTVEQMRSAELPPGPRAYHALVFSYVRANLPYEALDTAARAADEDVRLLPETFVVLIYAMLNYARPPDVEKAKLVLESMEAQEGLPAEGGTGQGGAPGWNMLCTELFRKGMIADAMTEVKKGNQKGYVSTPDLAKHVIEQLALAGLKEEAWQELASLVALGYRPGPDQYRHLVRAEAATGDWGGAHALLMDAMARPDWLPPNVEAFNSLLQGIVVSISPDKGRIPSSLGETAQDRMSEGLDADAAAMAESLEVQFARLREEMLLYGFRPNAGTHAAMCEGYIRLGDLDSALGSLQSMRDAGGSTQLVSRRWMSALLVSLAKSDRPMDLLNVLKSLVSANQRLPKSALRPIMDGTSMPGTTIATVWLPAHYEYMRTHKDRGDGGAGGSGISSAASGVRALMDQAMELRDFDGVKVSNLGNCVVEDDGSGIWIRPARMTTKQMMVELQAAGLDIPTSGKRKDLSNAVKAHRDMLPKTVKDIQGHLEQARKAEMEALERKTGLLLGMPVKPKRKGRVEVDQFRVLQMQDGKLRKILNVSQEVIKGSRSNYSRSVGGFSNYDEDLDLVMMGGRPMNPDAGDGPDEVDDIIREGVDEGVGEIIRSSDDIFGGTGESTTVGDETDSDTFDLTIDFMEARILNKSAGMSVAFEVLRSMEMLGATLSGPDMEALVTGAVTEENVEVALELSQRLPKLLDMGYEPAAVSTLYERLVRMCLSVLRGASADLVLERAEDAGLQVDPSLYVLLNKALAGRPRHRDLAKAEVEGMAEDPGVASILGDDAEAEEAVQAAEEEEEDDEEDEGEEQEELEQERQRGSQQQDFDQLEPLSESHVFSFGADLLHQLDSEAHASDMGGLEARSRQEVGLMPVQEQVQALYAQKPKLQQRLGQQQEEGEVVDAVAEQVQMVQARAAQEQRRDEEEAEEREGLPWTQADEMELGAMGGKETVLDLTQALYAVLEERLGSEEAAAETASRVLSDEGSGMETLISEGLLTEDELQLLLMRAITSGTGAVNDEEYDKLAEGQLAEEDTKVMSQLVELLGQEAFSQVMNDEKHPADFARTEEDAERLHALLDRFYSQGGVTEGGEAEEEAGEGEQQEEAAAQKQGIVTVTPEEAMQVAQLMPSPVESGLASFFDHLAHTQVARVRQTLNRQYSDPNWLAQKARRQHKRELVLAGLELREKSEEEEFDDAELERIVSQQDEEELPPLAFLPTILRSDDEVMKQVELFASEALAQSPGLFEPPAQPELLPGDQQPVEDEGEEGLNVDEGARQ